MGLVTAAFQAFRAVQVADILLQGAAKRSRRFAVRGQVEMLDFLPHDPVGHGIDIATHNIAPYAVCLHERRSATHEGISDTDPLKIMTVVEGFPEWRINKLRQEQCPKQRAGTTSKPFVDRDRRAIVLLYLFFAQS